MKVINVFYNFEPHTFQLNLGTKMAYNDVCVCLSATQIDITIKLRVQYVNNNTLPHKISHTFTVIKSLSRFVHRGTKNFTLRNLIYVHNILYTYIYSNIYKVFQNNVITALFRQTPWTRS